MEYAYAKIQGLNGESFYIQHLPTKLCRKVRKDKEEYKSGYESIAISDSHGIAPCHCLISYDEKMDAFFLIPFGSIYVDNKHFSGVEDADAIIADLFAKPPKNTEKYNDLRIKFNNYSKIYFPTDDTEVPLVFYLVMPSLGKSSFKKDHDSLFTSAKFSSKNKVPDKLLGLKWSADDKEQLKKFILIYGYGRWKQIQKASRQTGGKLQDKPISEVRGFANSYVRCVVENLTEERNELRKFLLSIIEEYPEDPYILPNGKDWDVNLLKQRANPWAKRIQLLYRNRMLIKKFKEEQRKTRVPWENLLNFLSSSVFYGQRPSVWWTKKHDVDLLRGTYKFGYANYHLMRTFPEYSFNELDKTSSYSEFPNADTITRRLKKLCQQIAKLEQKDGELDFESVSENELEGWETEEKKKFFKFIVDFGIPLNNEGKPNWMELREKISKDMGTGQTNKNISEIEKFVDMLRIKCQQIIETNSVSKADSKFNENDGLSDLNITTEDAQKFNKNYELLYFIRKGILGNKMSLFKSGIEELKKATQALTNDQPGFVPSSYDCGVHDKYNCYCFLFSNRNRGMLMYISDHGLSSLEKLSENKEYGFENVKMTATELNERLDYICEFFKNYLNQAASKKRRSDKPLKDDGRRKPRFVLNKDEQGNIIFPLVINPSLTLLDSGKINNTNNNYHSEHNLFPVGYKSVRAHASIFEKGKRALYTNEILEGPEGKPLYRVTSSEDPENPIVRDSSTGCWVYICSKVNDLADVKKTKVTISGTERFGLLEPNVCRILEDLEDAENSYRYKFKYRFSGDKSD